MENKWAEYVTRAEIDTTTIRLNICRPLATNIVYAGAKFAYLMDPVWRYARCEIGEIEFGDAL